MTPFLDSPLQKAAAIFPVRTLSSEKLSQFLPPIAVRWRLRDGICRKETSALRASSPISCATCPISSVFHVAARTVAEG